MNDDVLLMFRARDVQIHLTGETSSDLQSAAVEVQQNITESTMMRSPHSNNKNNNNNHHNAAGVTSVPHLPQALGSRELDVSTL